MKRQQYTILFLGLAIVLLCAACHRAAEAPAAITTIGEWQSLPAISLDCWEHDGDDQSWRQWRNTAFSDIDFGGLATDGDLLWISTRRGLFRLDVRTLECTAFTKADFTKADRFSLTGADQLLPTGKYLLLPDGEGGLWAGTEQGILRFSGGRWQIACKGGPMVYSMHTLGLRQTGDLCAETTYWRTGWVSSFCFKQSTLPLTNVDWVEETNVDLLEDTLDVMECGLWQRVAWRGYSDNHYNYYNYTTQAGCEQIARQIASGYSFIAVSPNGAETWAIKDDHLLHLRKDEAEQVELPYQDVLALAADPVHGGVWMATEDGLVHGKVRTTIEGEVSSTQYAFQPFSLNPEAFPGSVRDLVVDGAGQVWAVSQYGKECNVLRYSESDQAWHSITSLTYWHCYMCDVVAADPVRGVWIAGPSYFDGTRWRTWPPPELHNRIPMALLVNEDGRVWIGTIYGGLWTAVPAVQLAGDAGNKQPALDWRVFTTKDGLGSVWIPALARGLDGRIYAAYGAGISVFDPTDGVESGRWTTLPGSDADLGDWISVLAFAPSQAGEGLWVGYHHGTFLRRYQNGQWTDYHLPPGVGNVSALLVDRDGALWVGTTDGLLRWPAAGEGEPRWQTFDLDVLTMRSVLSLAQDVQGRIWVGGEEGVAMWEGNQ